MTAIRQLHFRDRRAPHEIQFALERELMTLLQPAPEEAHLTFRAASKCNGVPFRVLLRLEAALLQTNCYLIEFEAAEKDLSAERPQGPGKSLDGWLDLWTRHFSPAPAPAPAPDEGSVERAQQLAERAIAAEAHLADVASVQQEILAALRQGATYSTAHKEGGTIIRFQRDRFVRADFGESDRREEFRDEAAFLKFLRQFYHWETSRNASPQQVPEYDAWKLMLRLLTDKR
ncbi:MAG: hypothetical protein Q8N18_18710 [Opitutaceae bacterium]|nr:hypothetical protein [Opitutaceae bacterium]